MWEQIALLTTNHIVWEHIALLEPYILSVNSEDLRGIEQQRFLVQKNKFDLSFKVLDGYL